MKISIRRGGGHLGTTAACHNSPVAQAALRLDMESAPEPAGTELLCYEIRVEEGGNCRTVVVRDSDPPVSAPLRELLGFFEPVAHK